MNQDVSGYFDATSEIVQNSNCTCSDCGTAFCVSKRDHDTNQCIECKGCDAAFGSGEKSQNSVHIADSSPCKQLYKSMSEVNHDGRIIPIKSELQSVEISKNDVESRKNLSSTTAQLSAQIMNLSYREFKESVSQDQPEKVTYSTNDILKRIKEAYDKCSCKICECLTGQSVLTRINNCARSPCDCEPCNCKDCQDFLNMNNELMNFGIDPRLHYIEKANAVIERINGGFTKRDNQSYTCSPCNCDPCCCKECTKDGLNIKNEPPMRYITRTNTVLERLKNEFNTRGDDAARACSCEPCDCKDCKKDRLNISIDARIKNVKKSGTETQKINGKFAESSICNCKPCDCIQCVKNYSTPCDCKPCECYDCKSMPDLGKKTVIVAPVEEGTQRANCLCSPCDCARCSHRGLNLSPNRVHEMSTGINRHPNCHCEACVNDACEPNGTGSCRCEGRHGVISKPVENNPHEFDIRRATVSSKPLKPFGNRFFQNSTYVAMNINKFPSSNSRDFDKQSCKCSICECIVCKCKGNDFSQSKSSHNLDGSLKTLKLPSRELKTCQCVQCECQYCALKKQGNLTESVELKTCTCEKCDCIHCEGELKPRHTLSKLIPVMETGSKDMCRCKPCECNDCKKLVAKRKFDSCHCKICRCEHCVDEARASSEVVYPIKKGEILTASKIRIEPVSEPKLLSQSSEYTQIKHSMAQSNVFNSSKLPNRSQQNFTIYHMFPEKNIKKTLTRPLLTLLPENCSSKVNSPDTKSKSKGKIDPSKEDHLNHNNCPSTSNTLPRREISIIKINTISSHQENEEDFESPFYEDMVEISKISQKPSLLSTPHSAHNLLYLTPTCVSFHKTSCHLSASSPNRIMENSVSSFRTQKEINDEKNSTNSGELKLGKCHYCGSIYTKSEMSKNTFNETTQTPLNFTNYNGDNSKFEDPVLRYLLSDHSKDLKTPAPPKYVKYDKNDEKHSLKKEYYTWRLENPNACSYGVSVEDDSLEKTAHYERALITLKKAKEFSLELVTLLQKYDKANMEFESITKKLKQSHESILNDYKNDVLGHGSGSKDINYLTQIRLHNNKTGLMDVNHTKSSDDKELKEIKKYELDIKQLTSKEMNSLSTKHVNMIENKSSEQFKSKHTNKHQNQVSISTVSPVKDSTTEVDEKQGMKNSPSAYNAYNKPVKRSDNLVRKLTHKNGAAPIENQSDNMCDSMRTCAPSTIETDLLKTIIRHSILKQFGESTNNPMSSAKYSSENSHKDACEVLQKEKPVNTQQPSAVKSHHNGTAENKAIIKGKGSIIYINGHESMDASKSPSLLQSTEKQSSSHKRNIAMERLQNEVKELLNLAILQSTSRRQLQSTSKETDLIESRSKPDAHPSAPAFSTIDAQKTAENAAKSKVKEAQRSPLDSAIILAANPKSAAATELPSHNKAKCPCEVLKPSLEGLRRVSDHTVMVKWQPPLNLNDIKGFEVLVDGKPMDKVFLPTERMAVVTCLPHSERVKLGVRAVPRRAPSCGHRPGRALLYRPRERCEHTADQRKRSSAPSLTLSISFSWTGFIMAARIGITKTSVASDLLQLGPFGPTSSTTLRNMSHK